MIYEMRQYLVARGRMDDNDTRMRDHLPPLLAKHKVPVIGRWTALSGPKTPLFIYMMEWRDFAEREACWGTFYADPEWTRVRNETNGSSELIEGNDLSFLKPNAVFKQDDTASRQQIGGIHQLVMQNFAVGRNADVNTFLADTYLPRLRAAGAHVIGVLDMASGANMPRVVLLFAWPDIVKWREGWLSFQSDPAVKAAFEEQRKIFGTTLFGQSDTYLLEPKPYALPNGSLRTEPR